MGDNTAQATQSQTDEGDTHTTEERQSSDNETQTERSAGTSAGTVTRPTAVQRSSTTSTASTAASAGGASSDSVSIERSSTDADSLSDRYGLDVGRREAGKLQRLEDDFGVQRVSEWADEGMPVETMGKPRDMQAFRQRQANRSAEIPADIERRNQASVQRNTAKNHEDGPAGDAGVPDSVRNVISSPGGSLDPAIQRKMEAEMGDDFSDVQVHTGPAAANAAEDINAKAFTVGNHVAFNQGEYDPESREGQHTIAHELAHVRQQTGGAVSMLPKDEVQMEIDPDPGLEQEAEETAQRVMKGGELGVQRMRDSNVHIQRLPGANKLKGAVSSAKDKVKGAASSAKNKAEGAVDEKTEKQYRFSKGELADLVQSVETEQGLAEYLEYNNMEATSELEETADNPLGNAMTAAKMGAKAGTALGPVGTAVGGATGFAVGGILTKLYGKEAAEKVQGFMREQLGLSTDQEFEVGDDVGEGESQGVGSSGEVTN